MTTSVTGKLNKSANKFQAGDSTGFGIRLGVKYYDRETKKSEYTNYECAIFARQAQQVMFYESALVEGAIVEVSASAEKIKKFEGQNGLSLSIELIDAKLGYVFNPNQQAAQSQQSQSSQPMSDDFSDDLPFMRLMNTNCY